MSEFDREIHRIHMAVIRTKLKRIGIIIIMIIVIFICLRMIGGNNG
jgi:hypothetical protein